MAWAERNPEIAGVHVFGSYAKGCARPDSDLDIAVSLAASENNEKLGVWIENATRWKAQLQNCLPVRLDLDVADADLSGVVVGPAVIEHGILLYLADGERKQRHG